MIIIHKDESYSNGKSVGQNVKAVKMSYNYNNTIGKWSKGVGEKYAEIDNRLFTRRKYSYW